MFDANSTPASVTDLFNQVFQPKPQFPQWWQPSPDIGAILVMSQAELDDYKSRDWTPKPLPGSENAKPAAVTFDTLAEGMAELQRKSEELAAQQARIDAALARLDAAAGSTGGTAAAPAAPIPADTIGGLSDASSEDHHDAA